ncbi:uncharacterized protein DDB_G0271670-like [Drosophila nasuta]|uniref:uncharacterized protein DDB_G0271670-like n=1 Tax=Drosophila nasuta TaxID=42062 RepID=UPI00295EC9BE|nr:uncharacterized protein DDB_G0271670-like [Drosophila nasuta]
MKLALALSALLMLVYTVLIDGLNYTTSSTSSSSGPKICVLSDCNYFSTSNVCGRYGSSNLCKRFNNSCLLRYEGCVSSVAYTTVSLSMCSGISVGTRRRCASSSSSSSTSSSSSSSSSNVYPIYIRRRRG